MGLDSRDYYKPSGIGGFSYFPPVLKNLLIANGIVFLLQVIASMIVYGYTFGGQPVTYEVLLSNYFGLNALGEGFQIWQLVTYQFMHGDFSHIFFNMFMLWMFGMEIEHVMGSKKFLIFYLLSGIGAGLLQLFLSPVLTGAMGVTIGASGAVYGVMIAFGMTFPDRYVFIYFLLPIKAKYLIAILMVFEFMAVNDPSLVAHLAHIGGALTAFIFILREKKINFVKMAVFAFVGAILGIPLSYFFQSGMVQSVTGGFGGYLVHFGDVVKDGSLLANVILSILIFTIVGGTIGYFIDRIGFKFDKMFGSSKKRKPNQTSSFFKRPSYSVREDDVQDAKFYDITNNSSRDEDEVTQEEIDRILDKISQSGYQKLTEREKRILFEASKKK